MTFWVWQPHWSKPIGSGFGDQFCEINRKKTNKHRNETDRLGMDLYIVNFVGVQSVKNHLNQRIQQPLKSSGCHFEEPIYTPLRFIPSGSHAPFPIGPGSNRGFLGLNWIQAIKSSGPPSTRLRCAEKGPGTEPNCVLLGGCCFTTKRELNLAWN